VHDEEGTADDDEEEAAAGAPIATAAPATSASGGGAIRAKGTAEAEVEDATAIEAYDPDEYLSTFYRALAISIAASTAPGTAPDTAPGTAPVMGMLRARGARTVPATRVSLTELCKESPSDARGTSGTVSQGGGAQGGMVPPWREISLGLTTTAFTSCRAREKAGGGTRMRQARQPALHPHARPSRSSSALMLRPHSASVAARKGAPRAPGTPAHLSVAPRVHHAPRAAGSAQQWIGPSSGSLKAPLTTVPVPVACAGALVADESAHYIELMHLGDGGAIEAAAADGRGGGDGLASRAPGLPRLRSQPGEARAELMASPRFHTLRSCVSGMEHSVQKVQFHLRNLRSTV